MGSVEMTRSEIKLNPSHFSEMYLFDTKLSAITEHFGVSIVTIQKTRDSLNLPFRTKRVVYHENEYLRLFHSGETYPKMAKQMNMSRCSVISISKRLGLPNRHRSTKKVSQ